MQLGNPLVASNQQPAPNQWPNAAQHRAWSTYLTFGAVAASFSQNTLVRRTPSNFGLLYLLRVNLEWCEKLGSAWVCCSSPMSHPSTSLQRATTTVSSILGKSCMDGHFSQASFSMMHLRDPRLTHRVVRRHIKTLNVGAAPVSARTPSARLLNGQCSEFLPEFNADGARLIGYIVHGDAIAQGWIARYSEMRHSGDT